MSEAWRVFRIQSELVDGIGRLTKLGHAGSIFGVQDLNLEIGIIYRQCS